MHRSAAKSLLLAAVCALSMAACSHRSERAATGETTPAPVSAERVTKEELATYLDWDVELRDQAKAAEAEAKRTLDDQKAYLEMFARRRKEQTEIFAREPLRGSPKRSAINAVLQALYVSGSFARNDAELEKLRTRYGKEMVDSILDHDDLIREKLGDVPH